MQQTTFSSLAGLVILPFALLLGAKSSAATVTIDDTPAGKMQIIDGFGTCNHHKYGDEDWYQKAYFDDLGSSIMRMDITPSFVKPYCDDGYNCPWFGHKEPLAIDHGGGPDHNNCRTYTG